MYTERDESGRHKILTTGVNNSFSERYNMVSTQHILEDAHKAYKRVNDYQEGVYMIEACEKMRAKTLSEKASLSSA